MPLLSTHFFVEFFKEACEDIACHSCLSVGSPAYGQFPTVDIIEATRLETFFNDQWFFKFSLIMLQ
jgi:hypothetical protein